MSGLASAVTERPRRAEIITPRRQALPLTGETPGTHVPTVTIFELSERSAAWRIVF